MPHKTNAVYNGQEKTICLIYNQPPHPGGWLFYCSEVVGNIPPFISLDSLDFCHRQGEYKKQSCPLKGTIVSM